MGYRYWLESTDDVERDDLIHQQPEAYEIYIAL